MHARLVQSTKISGITIFKTPSRPKIDPSLEDQFLYKTNMLILRVQINCSFKSPDRISNDCREGRNALFALNKLHCKSTNPKVMVQFYTSVVLPSVLFGCEIWTNLKTADISALNHFQHFKV